MKLFNVVFEGGQACSRYAEDENELIAMIAEEFPGRKILSIVEAICHDND